MAVDWDAVRHDYITTGMSLQQLAVKHGATKASVGRHSKAGAWAVERAAYLAETGRDTERDEDETPSQAPDLRDIADGVLRLTRAVQAVLHEAPERLAFNTAQYNSLMQGIAKAMEIQREAYGIRTVAQQDSYRLAGERLKIERDRLELERKRADMGGGDDGIELRIIMPGEEAGDGEGD